MTDHTEAMKNGIIVVTGASERKFCVGWYACNDNLVNQLDGVSCIDLRARCTGRWYC